MGETKNHLVKLKANDPNPHSDEGTQEFILKILSNKIPELDQGLVPPVNPTVHYRFNYEVPSDAFKDPDNDPFSIRVELIPDEFTLSYHSGSRMVTGILNDNTKHGTYIVRFYVEDSYNISSYIRDMEFQYNKNEKPRINTPAPNSHCESAYNYFEYRVNKSNYEDPEGEPLSYSFSFVDPAHEGWLSISQTSDELIFSGTPNNSVHGRPQISIEIRDNRSDTDTTQDTLEL